MHRNRILYLILTISTIAIGLLSRTTDITPKLIYPYLGDFLYAVMCFFIVGFLFPKMSSIKVTMIGILICFTIECLQLYQADWIVNIRNTRLGGLVLGSGFLWSDMVSYVFGGLFGYFLEITILTPKSPNE
jgi:hypothetical protein